jgi:hypothetical protein
LPRARSQSGRTPDEPSLYNQRTGRCTTSVFATDMTALAIPAGLPELMQINKLVFTTDQCQLAELQEFPPALYHLLRPRAVHMDFAGIPFTLFIMPSYE